MNSYPSAPIRWKRVAAATIVSCALMTVVAFAWYYAAILRPQEQAELTLQSIENIEQSLLHKRAPSQ